MDPRNPVKQETDSNHAHNPSRLHLRDSSTIPPQNPYNEDASGKLWSIYLSEAAPFDKALVESWKGDMDGILFFAGLFSASVTAFIIESYQNLQVDPRETTIALLAQISLQLAAASNGSHADAFQPPNPNSFKPSLSTIRVNAFWFLSLAFSVTCALAATLVQQWARSYLQTIDRRPAPQKKARIRAFLYEGVEKFHMTAVVEAIPTLLHMSVFLFFIGLVDFMFAVNSAIAYIVLGTLVACASLYITITILPAIRLQCPYRTPMSGIFWRFLECLKFIWELRNGIWMAKYLSIEGSMADDRVALASEDSPELHLRDLGAMRWTLASLTEDSELEPFVEGIALVLAPFHDQVAHEPLPLMVNSIRNLLIDQDLRLFDRIVNLLMSTRATHSLREEQRRRRAFSCMDAITSLCHIVNSTSSLGTWYTSQGLAKTLAALKVDPIPEIALAANNTTKAVTHRLLSDLSAVSEIQEPSWWGSSVTRELLSMIDDFGCMDAVFEQIKGFSPDSLHRSAEMPIDLRRLIELVRSIYIPDYLAKATQLPSTIPSDRRRRLVLCLETIYTTAGAFPCNQSTSEAFAVTANALVRLRQEDSYDISFYANWAATRIAYHIQCDIIRTACITHIPSAFSYYEDIFGNYFEILCALDTIPSVGNSAAKQQLNLGVESPGLREFRHSMTQLSKDKISDFISLTTSDEQQAFETFQLWSTGGVVTSDFRLPAKVILSQGHVGLVIGFLYSIQGRVLDDDLLDLTLDILTLLTRHLTACFSNNSAQTILARLVGAVAQNLHANAVQRQKTMDDHLDEMFDNTSSDRQSVSARKLRSDPERHGTSDVILKIIQTLFHLLGTIGDPESLPIAKAVLQSFIDDPMTLESVSEEALSTLTKMETTNTFRFSLWPPPVVPVETID